MILAAIFLVVLAKKLWNFRGSTGKGSADSRPGTESWRRYRFMVPGLHTGRLGIPTGGLLQQARVNAVTRPGPGHGLYFLPFPDHHRGQSPAQVVGPVGNGRATDVVNILYPNDVLQLDSVARCHRRQRTTMTVNAATPLSAYANASARRPDASAVRSATRCGM